jgi:hypothetical protein
MDKENVVCIHDGILFDLRKEGNLSFVAAWLNMEDTLHDLTHRI